MYGAFATDL